MGKALKMSEATWCEIGNMLDHWDQLPNDLKAEIEDTSPGLYRAIETIASSREFAPTK